MSKTYKEYYKQSSVNLKPHRDINKSEIPTKEEIKKRYMRIKKLEELGIEVNVLDEKRDNKVLEEDLDKLQASILIMQDKEIPEELRQKILDKNQKVSNSRLIQTQ